MDARKVLQLIQPTSVRDAMQITRISDNRDLSNELTVRYQDQQSSSVMRA
jgi:hypothetical protein